MGLEARCNVTWQGQTRLAAVHLDSLALEVRGRPRLIVALGDVRRAVAREGALVLETAGGTLTLALGAEATKWAGKVVSPPSRAKKLGLLPGQVVAVVGLQDAALDEEMAAVGARRATGSGRADLVFIGVEAPAGLARLAALRRRIEPDGAIWVVRAKGKAAPVKEGEVREAARAAGLVDVKVVAFSDTQSADKLVIPVSDRVPRPASRGKKA